MVAVDFTVICYHSFKSYSNASKLSEVYAYIKKKNNLSMG